MAAFMGVFVSRVHAHTPSQKRRNNHYRMLTGILKHEASTTSPAHTVSSVTITTTTTITGNTIADLSWRFFFFFFFFQSISTYVYVSLYLLGPYSPFSQHLISISLKKF
ncbi:hypothetical protein E2C01_095362 [Portunus trituberculatus]|uniref:Uncharacterized protein n=1 Tax=Portunus trituberculatus TaxID=210409 RepID=A0A5B7JZ74_PORTR|nr:hypothetical protein [Portunus trituberculatus]